MKALAERVSLVPANRTVDEVVDRLTTIERDLDGFFSPDGAGPEARRDRPPLPDGVACFNGMYLRVTEAVRDELPNFENPEFVERLDVLFAEFYLQAYEAAVAEAWISEAWAPLFARRAEPKLTPAAVRDHGHERAHQQRPRARARADLGRAGPGAPAGDSPERRDYEKVNAILQARRGRDQGPALRRADREGRRGCSARPTTSSRSGASAARASTPGIGRGSCAT